MPERNAEAAARGRSGAAAAGPPRPGAVTIQLVSLPDCPLVARVRATLRHALARAGIRADVEEIVGPYASPTLLIGGRDVTGRTAEAGRACRLDLPTEEQILTALGGLAPRPAAAATVDEPGAKEESP